MKIIVCFALVLGISSAHAVETEKPKPGFRLEYASERNIDMGCDGSWMGELGPRLVPDTSQKKQTHRSKKGKK